MNPLIEKQLKMLRVATLPENWQSLTTLVFHRVQPRSQEILVDHFYLLELEDYLLNNHKFALNINWNRRQPPTDKFMKVKVLERLGKMFHVIGVGFDFENKEDLDSVWEGWVPLKGIQVINELRRQ